jgi:hypothetical protein
MAAGGAWRCGCSSRRCGMRRTSPRGRRRRHAHARRGPGHELRPRAIDHPGRAVGAQEPARQHLLQRLHGQRVGGAALRRRTRAPDAAGRGGQGLAPRRPGAGPAATDGCQAGPTRATVSGAARADRRNFSTSRSCRGPAAGRPAPAAARPGPGRSASMAQLTPSRRSSGRGAGLARRRGGWLEQRGSPHQRGASRQNARQGLSEARAAPMARAGRELPVEKESCFYGRRTRFWRAFRPRPWTRPRLIVRAMPPGEKMLPAGRVRPRPEGPTVAGRRRSPRAGRRASGWLAPIMRPSRPRAAGDRAGALHDRGLGVPDAALRP